MKFICPLLILFTASSCQIKNSILEFNDLAASSLQRSPSSEIQADLRLLMGGRTYVESVFTQVFDVAKDSSTASTLKTMIFDQYSFGDGCDLYGGSELISGNIANYEFPRAKCDPSKSIGENMLPQSNSMRYANTMKTCDWILNQSNLLAVVVKKSVPDWQISQNYPIPNGTSISKAYQLFYPTESIPQSLLNEFITLSESQSVNSAKWKLIFNTLCISPDWQVF